MINPHLKKEYHKISSIDDAAKKLGSNLEQEVDISALGITPEQEFWGHCSNLETWVENGYDTRLMHSNIAFPLLKELKKYDNRANQIFKEDIIQRFINGSNYTQSFLVSQGYLSDLTNEEICNHIIHKDCSTLLDLRKVLKTDFSFTNSEFQVDASKNGELTCLYLKNLKLNPLPEIIKKMKNISYLGLNNNGLEEIPIWISELENLEELEVVLNPIVKLPKQLETIKTLKKISIEKSERFKIHNLLNIRQLEEITIQYCKIKNIPLIKKNNQLIVLKLPSNKIEIIPDSIRNLEFLEELMLSNNEISNLPNTFDGMRFLRFLHIANNRITHLPDSITKLENLFYLNAKENQIQDLPKNIGMMKNLRILILNNNQLKGLPDTITNLENLEVLELQNNNLTSIPENLKKLKKLKTFKIAGNPLNEVQ